MKRKDKVQLHAMSAVDLESQIRTTGDQIKKMNMERLTKPTKNVHEITQLKRKLAIMKTILHQKQQAEVAS